MRSFVHDRWVVTAPRRQHSRVHIYMEIPTHVCFWERDNAARRLPTNFEYPDMIYQKDERGDDVAKSIAAIMVHVITGMGVMQMRFVLRVSQSTIGETAISNFHSETENSAV